MGRINVVYHDHLGNGAPPNKGIKILSKLLSPKYQSQSSLGKQNKDSSSLKCVHIINTITSIRKEDKPEEGGIVEPNATQNNDHNTIVEIKEKVREKLSRSETVIGRGESRNIERDNLDDSACGDKKEAEEGE
ncbi:hypothetical protein Tco_1232932 [Tanacetum coccineum]